MKSKVESFLQLLNPVYSMVEYLSWDARQDQKINELNYQMWKELTKRSLGEDMKILEFMAESGELGCSVEEAFKKGWIFHNFHHHLDHEVIKREIDEMTGG